MNIIISPAKKMNVREDELDWADLPCFLSKAEELKEYIRGLSRSEAKALWQCNETIAGLNYGRFQAMDLTGRLTPALLSYEGIQYQYMAPGVFETRHWDYVQQHLRILSGFYGILRPLDGIVPYRLEMQAKVTIGDTKNLYDYWKDRLYQAVIDDSRVIINLASKEYSKCIEKYLSPDDQYITVTFCELSKGKLVTKGTYAKMARGEMVRYMAENSIEDPARIQKFNRLGYRFREDLSSETEYIFERKVD